MEPRHPDGRCRASEHTPGACITSRRSFARSHPCSAVNRANESCTAITQPLTSTAAINR
jgi:hypothetical protein